MVDYVKISNLALLPALPVVGDMLEVASASIEDNYKFDLYNLAGAVNVIAIANSDGALTPGSNLTVTSQSNLVATTIGSKSFTINNATDYGFVSGNKYIVEVMSIKPATVADSFDQIFIRANVNGVGTNGDSQTVTAQPFSTYKLVVTIPAGLGSGDNLLFTGFQNFNSFLFSVLRITPF